MYSEAFINAYSQVSFTHIPLLGIMGGVYLVLDVMVLSLLLFALLFACSFLFCISKPKENEHHELMPFNKEPDNEDFVLWP
jgi:uncharacterized membrane protein